MDLKAINPKNQKYVNKCIKNLIAYNNFNDLRDIADNNDDQKSFKLYDRKCEASFERFEEILYELPKGQQKAILKSKFY